MAALARYVVLKAPDKAEYRSCAVDCAMQLMADLPTTDRNKFVIFTARLSRTAKVRPPSPQKLRGMQCADAGGSSGG